MIPLTGYADRLSLRPGETISFKVSCQGSDPYQADLVRIRCADPNPDGPGRREDPVEAPFAGNYPARTQAIQDGSYVRVAGGGQPGAPDFTLLATIWPTLPGKGLQAVLSCFDPEAGSGAALGIGEDGGVYAIIGQADAEPLHVSLGKPLLERRWYRIWLCYEAASKLLTLGQAPVSQAFYGKDTTTSETAVPAPAGLPAGAACHIGALGGSPVGGHFNGKIERPQLFGRALAGEEIEAAARGEEVAGRLAHWDFSRGISSLRVEDVGPLGLHGTLVNLPARGMKGSNWSGREMCWRHAPEEYGAIHFHDDDLADCGWETDFSYTVPEDLPNGVYAARLRCGQEEDTIPFFVCPPKGTRTADLCVIISTFTYVIYANHVRHDFGPHWYERAKAWNAYPWNPADQSEYALSTYNYHSDGSGICHSSPHRPILTLRSGFLSMAEDRGSGLRHFQADTHLLAWLEAKGYSYDILTDQEVHDEGVEALAGYRTVLTCSHPEYHTKETLDALEAYRDGGGRFCYLGGNGFYWRIALHQEVPGVVEIRRGESGIRAWAAEPGEYYNAFDGAYGGLWRRNGRAPQSIAGVGFSAQGYFEGSYYRRKPGADDPRGAWILEGVEEEILGDFGVSGGGAAGYELDRVDHRLGSPRHALVLASSEGHGPSFVLVPEEHLTHVATWPGESQEALIRADMTFFETPNNGAVFATGSITFCGSLPHNNFDNNVSRIMQNVLDRFLDPEATFPLPEQD